jgi:hypothetical protein
MEEAWFTTKKTKHETVSEKESQQRTKRLITQYIQRTCSRGIIALVSESTAEKKGNYKVHVAWKWIQWRRLMSQNLEKLA